MERWTISVRNAVPKARGDFNIGDRVRLDRVCAGLVAGSEGVITSMTYDGLYEVQWDEYSKDFYGTNRWQGTYFTLVAHAPITPCAVCTDIALKDDYLCGKCRARFT